MKWSVELYGLWPNRAEWNARRISLSLHIFQRAGCRSPCRRWPLAVFWNENSRLEPIPSLPPGVPFERLSNPSSLANPFKSFLDTIPIFVSNLVQLLQTISSLIENSIKCKEFRSERRKVPRSLNFQRSKFNNKNSSIPELIISRAKKDAVGERQVICRKCRIRNRGDRTWPPPPAKYSIARVRNSRVLFDTDQPGPGRDSLGVYVTRAVHGGMVVCRNMARETSDSEFMRASSRAGSGITIFVSHGLHSPDSYVSSAPSVRCPCDSAWNKK